MTNDMIPSEAVTAGRIAQSVDRAIEKSTCPLCGADYAMDTPYKVRFTCGTFMSPLRKQFDSERGDVQSKACRLRRQLVQAQERERELRDILTVHERQQVDTLAREARLPNPLAHFTDGQLYDELRRRGWVAATWAEEGGKRE